MAQVTPIDGGFRLTIHTPGAQSVDVGVVSRKLQAIAAAITNWTSFWRDYAFPLIAERTQRNFETEGGFVGGWAPLSPHYAAWKARHYAGRPILQREGTLYRSLQWSQGAAGPGGIARIENTRAEFGTSVGYGIFHQRGTRRMPQRQVLAIPESQTWGRLLQRYVNDHRVAAKLGAA